MSCIRGLPSRLQFGSSSHDGKTAVSRIALVSKILRPCAERPMLNLQGRHPRFPPMTFLPLRKVAAAAHAEAAYERWLGGLDEAISDASTDRNELCRSVLT